MKPAIRGLGVAAMLLAGWSAMATEIFVDAANVSAVTNGTTRATAWTTIAQGMVDLSNINAVVKGGHKVKVYAGSYSDAIVINASHSGLSASSNEIQGVGDVRVWNPGGGVAANFTGSRNVLLDGFCFWYGTGAGVNFAASPGAVSNTVRNCTFSKGGTVQGVIEVRNSNNRLENCIIYCGQNTGVYLRGSLKFVMLNCIVVGCGGPGVWEFGSTDELCGTNNLFYGNMVNFMDSVTNACQTAAEINACPNMSGNRVGNPGFAKLNENWNFNAFYNDTPCTNTGLGGVNLGPYQSPEIVPVSSNTYYVATTGDDSRSKTEATNPATPWLTLRVAITNAVAGDTVIVKAGAYSHANNTLKPVFYRSGSGRPIRFTAEPGTTITGSGGAKLDRVSDVIIENFEFINNGVNATIDYSLGVYATILRNCRIRSTVANSAAGINFSQDARCNVNWFDQCVISNHILNVSFAATAASANRFTRCAFLNALGPTITSQGSVSFALSAMPYNRFENCLFSRGAGNGVFTRATQLAGSGPVLVNCTISGFTNAAAYLYGGNVLMTNCVVSSNGCGVYEANASGHDAYLVNCDFYNNRTNVYDAGKAYTLASDINTQVLPAGSATNNIVVDPLFVNAAANDFRLLTGSLCIDAGTVNTDLLTDYYGNPRKSGDKVDIGIYEYPAKSSGTLIQVR